MGDTDKNENQMLGLEKFQSKVEEINQTISIAAWARDCITQGKRQRVQRVTNKKGIGKYITGNW